MRWYKMPTQFPNLPATVALVEEFGLVAEAWLNRIYCHIGQQMEKGTDVCGASMTLKGWAAYLKTKPSVLSRFLSAASQLKVSCASVEGQLKLSCRSVEAQLPVICLSVDGQLTVISAPILLILRDSRLKNGPQDAQVAGQNGNLDKMRGDIDTDKDIDTTLPTKGPSLPRWKERAKEVLTDSQDPVGLFKKAVDKFGSSIATDALEEVDRTANVTSAKGLFWHICKSSFELEKEKDSRIPDDFRMPQLYDESEKAQELRKWAMEHPDWERWSKQRKGEYGDHYRQRLGKPVF